MTDDISKECREKAQATGNSNNGLNLGQNTTIIIILFMELFIIAGIIIACIIGGLLLLILIIMVLVANIIAAVRKRTKYKYLNQSRTLMLVTQYVIMHKTLLCCNYRGKVRDNPLFMSPGVVNATNSTEPDSSGTTL